MLIQTDSMKIRFWHIIVKFGDWLKPTHDGNKWPFIFWQTEEIVIPNFVVTIGIETVFTSIPHTTCSQFHQHLRTAFLPIFFCQKNYKSQTVIREKLCKTLSNIKNARKNVGEIDTSWFIEQFNSIKGLCFDGTFVDPLFHQICKFSDDFDCSFNIAIV